MRAHGNPWLDIEKHSLVSVMLRGDFVLDESRFQGDFRVLALARLPW